MSISNDWAIGAALLKYLAVISTLYSGLPDKSIMCELNNGSPLQMPQ